MSKAAAERAYKAKVRQLPRLPMGDPQLKKERVDAAKDAFLEAYPDRDDMVARYIELRDEKDKAEEVVKDINVDLSAIEQLIAEHFEAKGVEAVRTVDGMLSVYVEPYASVVDHDALLAWVKEQGLERNLRLPWQSMNSLTKQLLEDGQPEPDGVEIYAKTKFKLTGRA